MGMLSRYQKSGGFIQIVQLIETCGKQKQENFLNMIEKEDPRWAQAIKDKMLTIERIMSWDNSVLAEIAGRLQELTIATALHGFSPENAERFMQTFSHSQKRNVEDLKVSKTPTAAELSSALVKILQEVRSMITQGYIRLEKFAPEMVISEDIEDQLGKPGGFSSASVEMASYSAPVTPITSAHSHKTSAGHHSGGSDSAEVHNLQMKVAQLTNENNVMKTELKMLRDKLAQIRKIA